MRETENLNLGVNKYLTIYGNALKISKHQQLNKKQKTFTKEGSLL